MWCFCYCCHHLALVLMVVHLHLHHDCPHTWGLQDREKNILHYSYNAWLATDTVMWRWSLEHVTMGQQNSSMAIHIIVTLPYVRRTGVLIGACAYISTARKYVRSWNNVICIIVICAFISDVHLLTCQYGTYARHPGWSNVTASRQWIKVYFSTVCKESICVSPLP